jgi:hypothetical protein
MWCCAGTGEATTVASSESGVEYFVLHVATTFYGCLPCNPMFRFGVVHSIPAFVSDFKVTMLLAVIFFENRIPPEVEPLFPTSVPGPISGELL